MRSERKIRQIVLGCVGALLTTYSAAAVNPELLRADMQSHATEALTIDVTAVMVTELSDGTTRVDAAAVVRKTTRSATGLREGDAILLVYVLNTAAHNREIATMRAKGERGWAGLQLPGLPTVVAAAKSYRAFLARESKPSAGLVYRPSAGEFSFEGIDSVSPRETP